MVVITGLMMETEGVERLVEDVVWIGAAVVVVVDELIIIGLDGVVVVDEAVVVDIDGIEVVVTISKHPNICILTVVLSLLSNVLIIWNSNDCKTLFISIVAGDSLNV